MSDQAHKDETFKREFRERYGVAAAYGVTAVSVLAKYATHRSDGVTPLQALRLASRTETGDASPDEQRRAAHATHECDADQEATLAEAWARGLYVDLRDDCVPHIIALRLAHEHLDMTDAWRKTARDLFPNDRDRQASFVARRQLGIDW
jgi:hypothetical protein